MTVFLCLWEHSNYECIFNKLEDLEITLEDHIQKVLKPNFGAAWDEVGNAYEKEETFALSSTKTLEGNTICIDSLHIWYVLDVKRV